MGVDGGAPEVLQLSGARSKVIQGWNAWNFERLAPFGGGEGAGAPERLRVPRSA